MDTANSDTFSPQSSKNTTPQTPNRCLPIGEDLHLLNPQLQRVLKQQDSQGLVRLAAAQIDAGAHSIDINLGQGKTFSRQMKWVVETIQDQFEIPLFFSAPSEGLEEILTVHRGKATINAISANSKQLIQTMKTARQFEANLVILLIKPGLMTAGSNARIEIATEVLSTALGTGFPLENIYMDPILSIRPDPVSWKMSRGLPDIDSVTETLGLIKELSQGKLKTILSLSNSSVGVKAANRSRLQCRLLPLLAAAGLDAVIMNCKDKELMETSRFLNSPNHPAAAFEQQPDYRQVV